MCKFTRGCNGAGGRVFRGGGPLEKGRGGGGGGGRLGAGEHHSIGQLKKLSKTRFSGTHTPTHPSIHRYGVDTK